MDPRRERSPGTVRAECHGYRRADPSFFVPAALHPVPSLPDLHSGISSSRFRDNRLCSRQGGRPLLPLLRWLAAAPGPLPSARVCPRPPLPFPPLRPRPLSRTSTPTVARTPKCRHPLALSTDSNRHCTTTTSSSNNNNNSTTSPRPAPTPTSTRTSQNSRTPTASPCRPPSSRLRWTRKPAPCATRTSPSGLRVRSLTSSQSADIDFVRLISLSDIPIRELTSRAPLRRRPVLRSRLRRNRTPTAEGTVARDVWDLQERYEDWGGQRRRRAPEQ